MTTETAALRRGGGRSARVARRKAARKNTTPNPPGPRGGMYQPLRERDIRAIYDTALRILDEIGLDTVPPALEERAIARGARLNDSGRLCYPRALVEDIVAGAAKNIVFYGRDPGHDFELGGERVYFGTGGAAVQTLDIDSGAYRPSTLRDLYDFTRLIDTLDNVSWFTRCCVATDVPGSLDLDVNTAYVLVAGTTKPVATSFTMGPHVDIVADLFDMVLGGEGRFKRRPFCMAHITPVVSPLRYGEDAVEVTTACIRQGVPINAIIAALCGATAPATTAGMLAQTTAETLAALVLVNLFSEGYPVVFSNWPLVVDLRTGAFSGGGGEVSVLNAGAAQISNWLGLPGGVACSMSDAKAPDAQMGSEKAMSAMAAGLAGANMVYESSGMMASLLGASFEAFVLDNEMLGHVYRAIRGIDVSEETLGFDAIREAVYGEGHFLGSRHTIAAMERDFFYPDLADRTDPGVWAENGAQDIRSRARERARTILGTYYPRYIEPGLDRRIRERFEILLPEDTMGRNTLG